MVQQIIIFSGTFLVSYAVLWLAVKLIHRLTHDTTRNYRYGILIFALLIALYFYLQNLGR